MKEPTRLLHAEGGLARDILEAASRQAAPEAARDRALQLVSLALTEKFAGSRERARSVTAPAARPRRLSLTLGAALAAVVGGALLVTRVLEHAKLSAPERSAAPAGAASEQLIASAAAPRPSLDEAGATLVESSAPLASVERAARELTSAPGARPAAGGAVEAAPIEDDWLGEQFTLLAKARLELEAGNAADALRSLDDYERRFPEGTLGHQAAVLRERARQTKATETVPAAGFDLGI